ncbi:guanine nucleotide exchange factor [Aspergillus clavatus NRRL 1]|uniref:Ras guanine-nucleotide exchange protein, putative n=1 Tax=Aspergillus clavatus (strain ATCC 1007 / CBS 513.65 / DSM 816 / NCTC 3887 / NRRL 1 / QM 1276 / 107) TaxID=344612 RepID=A1CGW5_ASPCL|nr:Ras guanine-nucleotide exchange protein, putative [Aspergillus clavatus NRRL 1]EAW10120.1 Ras guanine-nucleotide exchange protein, putative [Aspergillus clavatus NRRL 1]
MGPMKRHIAPLKIDKAISNHSVTTSGTGHSSSNRCYSTQHNLQMSPPLTPYSATSNQDDSMERSDQPRAVFHNYLRAFYPFHQPGDVSPATITLPLEQGDIILVHSVHTNGWADGTLLDTGARGWLPTNYCEAYDQLPMRPLLKALTDFWDIIRGGCGSSLRDFVNQDLLKGLIAGVRILLVSTSNRPNNIKGNNAINIEQDKSECLTRDSYLLKRHDSLRRNRKTLLSDLAALVRITKDFQVIASGNPLEDEVEYMLDEMLLKAFRLVTRGVRFLDIWTEEVGLSRTIAELEQPKAYEGPLTPASETFTLSDVARSEADIERNESRLLNRGRLSMSRASNRMDVLEQSRPVSVTTKRISISHRVSYSGPAAAARNPNLASERLNATYDAFLGVLGSFIGLHLQSRSSTELVVTTEQAVRSCRGLLTVVEAVCEHDPRGSELLDPAKDSMYERLSELVFAARDAFRPAQSPDDELVFMPDEGKRLVDAATDCVRAAGNCLSKARLVLEQTGDLELEALPQEVTPTDCARPGSQSEQQVGDQTGASLRLPPPPLQIPQHNDMHVPPPTPGLTEDTTPSSCNSRTMDSPANAAADLPSFSSTTTLATSPVKTSFCSSTNSGACGSSMLLDRTSHAKFEVDESFGRGVTSTGSSFTYHSHLRDSEMSGVSQTSTRATSPDIGSNYQAPSLKGSTSHSTLAEEADETEVNILEKTYAHELIFKDGQIMGGSLRALIEKLTANGSTPDAMFVSAFYLTFRLFATPLEFAESLVERFDYIGDTPYAAGPVRLRVYNVFKGWLESHWRHDCDTSALEFIVTFAKTALMQSLPSAGKRLLELTDKVSALQGPVVPRLVSSMGKTNTATAQYVHPDTPLPPPILGKKEVNLLKQWKNGDGALSILDFDPMELARQLTIKESRIFCTILPEELLATEWMKKTASLAVNVRAMSTLSTDLAHLVADSILQLEEPKKRAAIIKHWVKIANKCLELNNYDSLMAIICSLNSSMISRLRRTWEVVSHKTKTTLEMLRGIVDVSRNYAVLRQRLQGHVPPCLPFVGTYLTDLTFVDHGNQALRSLPIDDGEMAVINFDKHMKTAKIISELQRFQIPYRLTEVPELQTWMQNELVRVRSNGEKSLQTFYRRSLVLEPRETPQRPTLQAEVSSSSASILENAKDKFDLFSWTYPSKAKSVATHG